MAKKIVLGGLAVFVAWSVLDFIIHGVILRGAYEATMQMWRPMAEMKTVLTYVVVLLVAFIFAAIYAWLVRPKNVNCGFQFGLLWGLAAGLSMGYGSYAVMPIPYGMAFTWFAGTVVEGIVAGFLVGLIVTPPTEALPAA